MDFKHEYASADDRIRSGDRLTECALPRNIHETHSHHEQFEIYWFLEGDLWFSLEGNRIEVSPGDMIFIGNRLLHRPIIKTTCRYRRKRLLFGDDLWMTSDGGGVLLKQRLVASKYWQFHAQEICEAGLGILFDEVETGLSKQTPFDDFAARVSLLRLLVTAASRYSNKDVAMPTGKVGEMIRYIEQNMATDLNYRSMAKTFYLSEQNLYRVFKRETGFTLGKYIKEQRIIRAKQVLTQGGSAYEAATAAGFKEYSVFYRNFVRKTGMTPSQFAKSNE